MPPKVSGRPLSSADSKSSAGGSSSSDEEEDDDDRRNDLKKKDTQRQAEHKANKDHHDNDHKNHDDDDDEEEEEEEEGSSSGSGSDSGSGSGDDSSDSDNDDESGSSSSSSGSSSTESDSSAASQRSTTRSIAAAAAAAAAASARKNVSLSSRSGSARSSRASSSREDQSPPPRPSVKAAPKKRAPAASSAASGQARRAQRASSASSASDTGGRSTSGSKKTPAKKGASHTTAPAGGGHRKVAPKKSATAKPIAQATALTKSNLSESNSEDSDFGEFSLTKFTSKAKAAKNSALSASLPSTASSSASNTPKPNATPGSTPGGRPGATTSGASPAGPLTTPGPGGPSHATATASGSHAGRSKGPTPAKSGSGPITSMSHYGSIFNTTSEDSDLDNGGRPSNGPAASVTSSQTHKKTTTPPKKANIRGNTLKVRVNSKKLKAQESPVKRGRAPANKAALKAPLKAPTNKVGAKATPKSKAPISKRSVSVSSSSSVSSKLSQSSSDSSDDEEVVFKTAAARKMSASAGSGPKKKGRAPSGGGNATNSNGTLNNPKKGPKPLVKPKKPLVAMSTDESDVGDRHATARPTTRQTRGAAPRRSKHITGRGEIDSESEVDQTGNSSSLAGGGGIGGRSSPKKNAANSSTTSLSHHHHHRGGAPLSGVPSLPPVRRDLDGLPPIETRKCPIPGCDSSGHLGGKLDRHFLAEACPVYHNTTRKACRDMRSELNKRAQVRKKALVALSTKSPLQSPTSEQKKHFKLIKEERAEFSESDVPFSMEEPPEEREPDLKPYASEWDLKLFREAQGLASEDLENSLKGLPDAKTTKYLEMGKNEMEVWYQSPYPEEFTTLPKIYLCEFCLKYMKSASVLRRHAAKCVWKHPPGDEIYRKDKLSVFEICGKRHKQYCQNLCLLAKFFLDHKTLYFDVEPFLFYVMTTADSEGCHIVGYFSKEKNSFLNYNVSCILTLPPYQRQGFGRLLIDFSYLLSRVEGKIGSPEKPLSDLGLITYRAYWKDVLLEYICNFPERETSIKSFSEEMGINSCDIVSTLQYLGMIKYWKGQHVILKKEDLIDTYMAKVRNRPKGRQIYASALKWKPYEPSSKEKRHAELIKKSQEERQKKR